MEQFSTCFPPEVVAMFLLPDDKPALQLSSLSNRNYASHLFNICGEQHFLSARSRGNNELIFIGTE